MSGAVAVFPCSSSQARLWVLEQLGRGGPALVVRAPLVLDGAVQPEQARATIQVVVDRHDALRTTFSDLDGHPVQRVRPAGGVLVSVPFSDLSDLPPGRRGSRVRALAQALTAEPFDLTTGPLVRAHLLRTGEASSILLLAFHHIVVDGWSVRTIHDELTALLAGERSADGAGPPPLPALTAQYPDYALWQRRRLADGAHADDLQWWVDLHADSPDRPPLFGSAGASSRASGARLTRPLTGEVTHRVRDVAAAHGATPFAVVLAAYATAVQRHTGQRDLVIGTPVSGRTHADLEPVVGFFVNTLPLRVQVAPGPFGALVEQIRDVAREAFDRQDVPHEEIARRVARADQPLVEVMFNLLEGRALPRMPAGAGRSSSALVDSPGPTHEPTPSPAGAHSTLELYAMDDGEGLRLELVYDVDRVDGATARRLLDDVARILADPTAAPPAVPGPAGPNAVDAPVASGGVRPSRSSPRHAWPEAAREQTLTERFCAVARRHPDRPAVHDDDGPMTYADLLARALAVSAALRADGAAPPRVGVLAGHGRGAVAAVLGALCAGAAYVPLDPHSPPDRLAQVVDDAGLATVLADAGPGSGVVGTRLADLLAARPELRVLDVRAAPAAPAGTAPAPGSPDDVAYLIYTSGSTGEPKGVVQSHRNVMGNLRVYAEALDLGPDDALSLLAGVGTDAAVMDLFGALLTGACLHPVDIRAVGPDGLAPLARERGITVLHLTPSLFREVVTHLDSAAPAVPGPAGGNALDGVRLLVLGGEPATRADLAAFARHFAPSASLVNGYGPTESTLALQFFADHATVVATEALPLGEPVAGMSVAVEDSTGRPVPAGSVGEIVLRGPHVALGYWGRPVETAAAFPDSSGPASDAAPSRNGAPASQSPGTRARTYRSGDLARVHPDGTLTFAGRTDDQIKVRGFRIEPSEIEAILRREPGVLAVAVTASSPLTAYLVPAPGAAPTARSLRRTLRRSLPEPMVPTRYVAVDRLPLTPSGKIDRRAAPSAPGARPLADRPRRDAAPRRPMEAAVVAVWAEVLDVDQDEIAPDDTFFDFGGHSLLLTQVASRLVDRLGVRLPLSALFENPTLRSLSTRVAEARALGSREGAAEDRPAQSPAEGWAEPPTAGGGPERIPRRPPGPGPYPLSSAQARLWFLEELNPGRATYTMSLSVPMPAGTARADVQDAVDRVVARHEALRTTFAVVDGQPVQQVGDAVSIRVAVTDLSGLPHEAALARRRALANDLAATAFDLRRGPLLRAHLVDLGTGGASLLLALHHIVADGWSLTLLRQEISLLLAARRDGRPPTLPEPALQYVDYAVWERTSTPAWADGLRWWADRLSGSPARLDLPTNRPRPATPSSRGALAAEPLDADLVGRCRLLARRHGATPFMVYLAAFAAVLHRWSGQEDMVIGSPVAGRTRVETEDVVGLFVNSLPLRVAVAPDRSFLDLLADVREVVTSAQDHQDVPFEEIVRRVAPYRRLAHAPVFQVMFAVGSAVEPEGSPGPTGPGLPVDEVAHTATAKFDLSMTVDDGTAPAVFLEYATDLYDEPAARHLLRAMLDVLAEVTRDPDTDVARLPLTTGAPDGAPGRSGKRVGPAGSRVVDVPRGGLGGLAVVAGAASMSHADLAEASAALARRLRTRGLGSGAVVAMDLPRGPDLIVAMLGARAAGLALLLLDPRLPAARRAELLERSGTALIIDSDLLVGNELAADGAPPLDAGPAQPIPGDLPAYVVPTSGSTGRPKLVVVPRRALDAQVAALLAAYELGPTDRVLQFASLGFDVAIEEILPTIAAGATLDLGPAEGPPSFADLEDLCGPGGVTVLNLPASYWHEWVAFLTQRAGRRVPAGLRLVVVGSEPVHPQAVARWHALDGACRLLCAYGTSETTITNALFEPPRDRDWAAEARVPIGVPLPTGRLVVVDPAGRPVPPGVLGELAVEGVCLADGYLGEPDRTAERFVDTARGRRYLTGDLARERFDGDLEVVGRLDDQVKVLGHRIEPGEVEAALVRRPGVRAAAVAVRAGPEGRPRLVAYVVPEGALGPRPGAEGTPGVDHEDLRSALLRVLPEHLVPGAFVTLDALPRTPGGKVDRARLPDPVVDVAPATGPAPDGPVECAIAEVWAETLGMPAESIFATSNFFDLGGDSILSLQIAWRLAARGLTASLADLFTHQSVAELAAAIAAANQVPRSVAEPIARSGPVPLTPVQVWHLAADSPEPAHDNQAVLVRLDGRVTVDEVRAALAAVIATHDALRARFAGGPGGWRASIVEPGEAPVTLQVHPAGADLAGIAARSHAGLDLAEGPVFRADLVPDGPDPDGAVRLLLVAHHLVVDVVSWQILLGDLETALRQVRADQVPRLPAVPAPWRTWATRLADWAAGDDAADQARWWLDRPQPPGRLIRLPEAGGVAGDERVVRAVLGKAETGLLLRALPGALGARIDEAIVAALARALAEQPAGAEGHLGAPAPRDPAPARDVRAAGDAGDSGGAVVLLDVEGHGREPLFDDLDLSRTVGWLTTLRPVAVHVAPGGTTVETLAGTREALRSMPRHGIAHGAVRYLRPPDDPLASALAAQPSPQVSVNYLGRLDATARPDAILAPDGPAPGPARSPLAPRPYALDVVAGIRDDELLLWLAHDPAALPPPAAEALLRRCIAALAEVADACRGLAGPDAPTPHDGTDHVVAAYPLTPMQQAMVYAAEAGRGAGVYVEHSVLPLPASAEAGAVRLAWEYLVERHEILRTRIVIDADGGHRQEVVAEVTLPWRVVDWRHLSPADARARLAGLLEDDRRRGFEIDRAPLMRFVLVFLPDGAHLVWSHHHVLLDGWSAARLLEEFATALRAAAAGTTPDLPPVRPFRDYVAWLAGRDPAADEAYWAGELRGLPEGAGLPTHDVGAGQPRARALTTAPSPAERAAIGAQARALRVSPATLAHAAWALVLSEYTRSEDVVFGVTASGRPADLARADAMVGLLITTHPARVRLPGDRTVRAWVSELAAREVTNREHAYAGLAAIARWAGAPAGSPLVESLLVVENYGRAGASGGDDGRAVASGDYGRPSFEDYPSGDDAVREAPVREIPDVPLSAVVGPDLRLTVLYDARRFDGAWAADVLRAFRHTLRALAAASPESALADLDVLGPDIRRRMLEDWNATARPIPRRSLGAQWADAAARYAGSVAVVEPGRTVTYAELAEAADRIAARLRAAGAVRGELVGVVGERSAELVAAVLGIVRAGCAYVPLDPAYPDERLALLVADTGMRLAVGPLRLLTRLPASLRESGAIAIDGVFSPAWARVGNSGVGTAPADPHTPDFDTGDADAGDADTGDHDAADPDTADADPDAPAYVIYTSGSTGRPKGVVVPHRAVTRLVVNTDYCSLGPGDTVALASTFAFDASTFEIWGALLAGARLAPIDTDTLLSPPRLAAALRTHGVTTMFLTTAAFNAVAAEVPDAFAPLTTVLFGGERVEPRRVRDVLRAGPPRRLLHVYGPTEATTFASWHEVRDVPDGAATVPIGRPIANTELLVLDGTGRLVPPGVEGELVIGGPGLALGYLGDAELTARRFVAHPFRAGARLYRTGDVVVQRSDGVIEIRGRRDGQVKIRGFRIEPGEVESRLLAAPGVGGAVVVPRRESADVHYLAAYVVPVRGASLDPVALRAYLRVRLPEHLVPSTVTVLPALPLTPNGKVDRERLPDPRPTGSPGSGERVAGGAEAAIADIWAGVLKVPVGALSPGHDFFDLGGHSLLLTQVAARLRRELEVDLPLRVLFETRRLGDLAALVEGWERTPEGAIPVLDRTEFAGTVDEQGRLTVPAGLAERLLREAGA